MRRPLETTIRRGWRTGSSEDPRANTGSSKQYPHELKDHKDQDENLMVLVLELSVAIVDRTDSTPGSLADQSRMDMLQHLASYRFRPRRERGVRPAHKSTPSFPYCQRLIK